jgi:hypothetical protein
MSATGTVSGEQTPAERMDGNEKVVLILLLDDRLPWTLDELGRKLKDRVDAADAIATLSGDGLVHRLGDFVFPTRAARRSDELYDGAL